MKQVYFSFSVSKIDLKNMNNMSKLAKLNEENLFGLEVKTENSELPTYLFEEIEQELTSLIIEENSAEEETDGAFDVIRHIAENIRSEIDNFVENGDLKKFLYVLAKIFTLLLNVKADNSEKIIRFVKLVISSVVKNGLNKISSLKQKNKALASATTLH